MCQSFEKLQKISVFKLIVIVFVLIFVAGCASRQAPILPEEDEASRAATRAFKELNEQAATEKAQQKTTQENSAPTWYLDQSDENYFYTERYTVITNPADYSRLYQDLRHQIYQIFAERVKVQVNSFFKDIQIEQGDTQKNYVETILQTYSSTSFFADEIDWVLTPAKNQVSAGDTLTLYARFNVGRYRQRMEQKRFDAERKATETFQKAYMAFDRGEMQNTLDNLTRTKYYIDQGGGGERTKHYKEPTIGDVTIYNQFYDLYSEIRKTIKLKILTDHTGDLVKFNREDPTKFLRIQVYSEVSGNYDLRAINVELYDRQTPRVLQTRSTDAQGVVRFNLRDALKEKMQLDLVARFKLHPHSLGPNADNADLWYSLPSYVQFKEGLSRMPIRVELIEFQPKKVTTLISSKFLDPENLETTKTDLENQISDNDRFFDLFKKSVGMRKEELDRVVNSGQSLNEQQMDKLRKLDFVIALAIEKGMNGQNYRAVLKMYQIKKSGIAQRATVPSSWTPSIELALKGVKDVFNDFMSLYFEHILVLKFDKKVDYTIKVNGNTLPPERIKEGVHSRIKGLSRYHSQTVTVHTEKYRTYKIQLKPEKFLLEKKTVLESEIQEAVTLQEKQGTLDIRVFNQDRSLLPNIGREQTTIEWYQPKWVLFKQNHGDTTGVSGYSLKVPPGRWYVNASHPGYLKPTFTKKVRVHDKYEMQGAKQVSIVLEKKPLSRALLQSTALPGWGHRYLDKPVWQQVTPAVTFAGFAGMAIYKFFEFYEHKSDFIRKQRIYENAGPEDWDAARGEADTAWDNMQSTKSAFQVAVTGAILTNLSTSALLYIEEEWN